MEEKSAIMCSWKAKDNHMAGDCEAETSGVYSTDSRETGACRQCTCVARKVDESWGAALFCCQGKAERLAGGSDE